MLWPTLSLGVSRHRHSARGPSDMPLLQVPAIIISHNQRQVSIGVDAQLLSPLADAPCLQVAFGNAGFLLLGKVSSVGHRQSVFHQVPSEIDACHEADAEVVVITVLALDDAGYIA